MQALERTVAGIPKQPNGATSAPIYEVPVVNGVATPDLSKGSVQRVTLTADTVLSAPKLLVSQNLTTFTWTLFLDQDKSWPSFNNHLRPGIQYSLRSFSVGLPT